MSTRHIGREGPGLGRQSQNRSQGRRAVVTELLCDQNFKQPLNSTPTVYIRFQLEALLSGLFFKSGKSGTLKEKSS